MTDNKKKKTRKRYSRLIDRRNGEQQEQKQKQQQLEQQNKETDELSIDNHILRIKRVLNEFVDKVENNSFPFLNRRMK